MNNKMFTPSNNVPRWDEYNGLRTRLYNNPIHIGNNISEAKRVESTGGFILMASQLETIINQYIPFSMTSLHGEPVKASEDAPENIVCMMNVKNVLLNPCSHVVYCVECAKSNNLSKECRVEYISAQIIYT